jgi:hypothetical protein
MPNVHITVEFGGGAELLFDNKKTHSVTLPEKEKECKCLMKFIK